MTLHLSLSTAENLDQLLEEKLNDSDDCSRMKNSFRDFINSKFFSSSKSNLQLSSLVMANMCNDLLI